MNWDTDPQFTENKLTSVEASPGGWDLGLDGSHLFCTNEHCQKAPAVGETARLYGKGFGYMVRGIIIEGRVYRYRTEEQQRDRHAAWCSAQRDARQNDLDDNRATRDIRREALPEVFRDRLIGFEAHNADWRREFGPYELMVCETAAALAKRFGTDVAALRVFADGHGDEMMAEHSGNSWGAAVMLAERFMREPESVLRAHGALCPLVGCAEYGCRAARRAARPADEPTT